VAHSVEFYIALGQFLSISPDDTEIMPKNPIDFVPHPFPPAVCIAIARLPTGFAEVALTGQLSRQCINLLASVTDWVSLVDHPPTSTEPVEETKARYCRLFCEPRESSRSAITLLLDLKRSGLRPGLEQVICLGLAIAVRHLSGENRTNIFDTASLAALTKSVKAIDNPSVADSEVMIWIALLVSWRTQSKKSLPKAGELLDYILETFPASRMWKKISAICRKFWWFEQFQHEWKKSWTDGMARQGQVLEIASPPATRRYVTSSMYRILPRRQSSAVSAIG
jgi:hypothetical protein